MQLFPGVNVRGCFDLQFLGMGQSQQGVTEEIKQLHMLQPFLFESIRFGAEHGRQGVEPLALAESPTHDVVVSFMDTYNVVEVVSPTVNVKGGSVFLGDGAREKVVLGDSFKTFFNRHTHPSPAGPTSSPAEPMTDAVLSRNVKTRR